MDGYVYNSEEEPKILMTGKWNESMSYQPCDLEGEPLPGTELKEVSCIVKNFIALKNIYFLKLLFTALQNVFFVSVGPT